MLPRVPLPLTPAVKVMMPFACVLSLGDEQSDDKGLTPAAPTLRSPPHPHRPGKGRYRVIRRVRSGAPTTRAWTHADCTHTMTRVDEKPIVQMQVGEKAPCSEPHTVPGSKLGVGNAKGTLTGRSLGQRVVSLLTGKGKKKKQTCTECGESFIKAIDRAQNMPFLKF